jgi:hypothetical protein
VFPLSIFLALNCFGQSTTNVTLAWNPSSASALAGYKVYYGGSSQTYTSVVSVGLVTNATLSGMILGRTYYFAATSVDSLGVESQLSNETSYTVPTNTVPTVSTTTNTPPFISAIANQTIPVNTVTPALAFTVGDRETPAASLTVAANSSNPVLLPNSNIVLAGTGTNRSVTLTPAAGQTGTATVALTVCDTSLCTTASFQLTVNPLPTVALIAPAVGASYSAPASVTLTASVNANGHTITAVQFYSGSAYVGQAAAAPYTFTWNNVAGGSYSVLAKAVFDGGSTVASTPCAISVQGLTPPWQTADIGTVGVAGNAAISNGAYTVHGAGNVSGSSDNFRFLYQSLTGDGEIRAQVLSDQNTGSGDICGAMIRETLTSGSRYALMGISPGSGWRWQRRNSTGNGTSSAKSGNVTPPNVWTRLVRSGNTLSGYKSTDGANWTLVNSSTIVMATNIYIGFAVGSGMSGVLNSSVFTNATVVP